MLLTEATRKTMAIFAALLSFLCVGPSVLLIAVGAYAHTAFESKIRLIENFNTAALPTSIMVVGLYSGFHNVVLGTILLSCRSPKMRENRSGCLLPSVILGIILIGTLLFLTLVAFGQTMLLERSFEKGLFKAMHNYKTNSLMKSEIDNLQIEFKCCGSKKYTDWFKISWIRDNYVSSFSSSKKTIEGGYVNDDVPFSCCDIKAFRPCINHHVHDNDMHYSYDYRTAMTIYHSGCKESLVQLYGRQLMTYVGMVILGVSLFQLVVVCLTRILQTSIKNALELDDPEATTKGYIFSSKTDGDDDKGVGEDEETPLVDTTDAYEREEEKGEEEEEQAEEEEEQAGEDEEKGEEDEEEKGEEEEEEGEEE